VFVIQNFPIDIGPILNYYGVTGVLIFTNALLRNTFYKSQSPLYAT